MKSVAKSYKKIKIIFIIYVNNLYSVCFDRSSTLQDMPLKIIVFFYFCYFIVQIQYIFFNFFKFVWLTNAFHGFMYCLQHLTKPRKPVMPKDKQQENGSTNVPSNQVNLFPNAKNIVERFSICIILRTHYDEPNIHLLRSILQIQLVASWEPHEDSSSSSEITWYTVLVSKIVHLGFTWQGWLHKMTLPWKVTHH